MKYNSEVRTGKHTDYLYIYSSLKDSYAYGEQVIPAFKDGPYKVPLHKFIDNLSRQTSKRTLPYRYRMIEGVAGGATQIKVIIRVPYGWTAERFEAVALREWGKNPSVDMVIAAYVKSSVDMDLSFFQPTWGTKGRVA